MHIYQKKGIISWVNITRLMTRTAIFTYKMSMIVMFDVIIGSSLASLGIPKNFKLIFSINYYIFISNLDVLGEKTKLSFYPKINSKKCHVKKAKIIFEFYFWRSNSFLENAYDEKQRCEQAYRNCTEPKIIWSTLEELQMVKTFGIFFKSIRRLLS